MEQEEVTQQPPIHQPIENPFGSFEYASVGQRFANYMIDLVIFYVVVFGFGIMTAILSMIAGNSLDDSDSTLTGNTFLDYFVVYGIYALYYTFSEGASRGRSLGKLITRTKVVRDDGSEISWKDALIRSVARAIPFEPFTGFDGYPLHDRLSHTKVIKIKK